MATSTAAAVSIVCFPGIKLRPRGGLGGGGVSPVPAYDGTVPAASGDFVEKSRGRNPSPADFFSPAGVSGRETGVGSSTSSHERGCLRGDSAGAALSVSAGILAGERSISGSMDWISSSKGRAAGILAAGGKGGACTGADTCGIWAIGEPQRLQKTDPEGTLLPHFEQNTLVPGAEASNGLTAGEGWAGSTGLAVTGLRTGVISSVVVAG